MGTREMYEERRRVVAELWQQGIPGHEIARRMGMSQMSVHTLVQRMRREGHPLTNRNPNLSERYARAREAGQTA